jgi:hypothetical protein
MMIILDGCFTCAKGGKVTGMRLTHFEEGGGLFSACNDEKEYEAFKINHLSINIPASNSVTTNSGSFTLPIILIHRICSNYFKTLAVSEKYVDIKLHVEYR